MTVLRDAYQIVAASGQVIAVATAEVTEAVVVGRRYVITTNTDCFVRFSASAVTSADDNFDLFMPAGSVAILQATNAVFRAIRLDADGTLGISEVDIV